MRLHLKIDTGMHRNGIDYEDFELIKSCFELSNVQIEGVHTHLANSDILYGEFKKFSDCN